MLAIVVDMARRVVMVMDMVMDMVMVMDMARRVVTLRVTRAGAWKLKKYDQERKV